MSIEISSEQQDLKEEHARRPDRRAASVPGDEVTGNDGLNEKEEAGTEEDRSSVKDHETPGGEVSSLGVH